MPLRSSVWLDVASVTQASCGGTPDNGLRKYVSVFMTARAALLGNRVVTMIETQANVLFILCILHILCIIYFTATEQRRTLDGSTATPDVEYH